MRKINLLLTLLLSVAFFSACSSDDNSDIPQKIASTLSVDKESLTFKDAQVLSNESITITSNDDWVIDYPEENWFEVDKKSGKGDATISISLVKKNYTDTIRTAKLNIKSPTGAFAEKQIEIKHSGVDDDFNILTAIPDENFRLKIKNELFHGKDIVTIQDAKKVEYLYVIKTSGIKSIEGISFFVNIRKLYIILIPLNSTDFISNLIKLKSLSLIGNELEEVNLASLTNLEELFIEGNKLKSIDLSNLLELKKLSCSSNRLSSLDVSKLINLETLMCNMNQLTSLDISNLPKLKNFQVTDNQLTELDISKSVNLDMLFCKNNQLTSLDLLKLTKLGHLICWSNPFTAKSVKILKNLHNSISLDPKKDADIYDWVSN